jgi:hypothetical protein
MRHEQPLEPLLTQPAGAGALVELGPRHGVAEKLAAPHGALHRGNRRAELGAMVPITPGAGVRPVNRFTTAKFPPRRAIGGHPVAGSLSPRKQRSVVLADPK